jgi:hypothetical protein
MTIKTNNQYRNLMSAHELSPAELKAFDYLGEDEGTFFRYRGNVYDLGEFMRTLNEELKGWDGFAADTYFSGVAVKLSEDGDQVKVASCYC